MTTMGAAAARRWDRLILWGWIVAFSLIRAGKVNETDPFWQIRAGQEVLDGSPLARPDTWSWAPVDGLFYPNSPAWNVALALSWNTLGSWGVFLLAAASIAAYLALVVHLGNRLGATPLPTAVALLLIGLMALPMFSARAGVASQVVSLGAVALAMWWSSRAGSSRGAINAVVVGGAGLLISFIGNWIHLSWSTMAVATAVAWAVIWLLTPLTRAARLILIVSGFVGLAAGVVLGPYGSEVFEHANEVLIACRGLIVEWTGAFAPPNAVPWAHIAVISVALSLAALTWSWRTWRTEGLADQRVRLSATLGLVALPAAIAGVIAIRFTGIALLTIAPVAAALATEVGRLVHARLATGDSAIARKLAEYTTARFWRVILTATLIVVAPFFVYYAWKPAAPTTPNAIAALPPGCRLFSLSNEAGAVILKRPDVKVWTDGRADYWGRQRLMQVNRYLFEVDQEHPVPPGTTCILLPDPATDPSTVGITAALDSSTDWQRLIEVDDVVVWVPARVGQTTLS